MRDRHVCLSWTQVDSGHHAHHALVRTQNKHRVLASYPDYKTIPANSELSEAAYFLELGQLCVVVLVFSINSNWSTMGGQWTVSQS